jgi:hypothetical protein
MLLSVLNFSPGIGKPDELAFLQFSPIDLRCVMESRQLVSRDFFIGAACFIDTFAESINRPDLGWAIKGLFSPDLKLPHH